MFVPCIRIGCDRIGQDGSGTVYLQLLIPVGNYQLVTTVDCFKIIFHFMFVPVFIQFSFKNHNSWFVYLICCMQCLHQLNYYWTSLRLSVNLNLHTARASHPDVVLWKRIRCVYLLYVGFIWRSHSGDPLGSVVTQLVQVLATELKQCISDAAFLKFAIEVVFLVDLSFWCTSSIVVYKFCA